jgi:hypothetical protein
LTGTRVMVYGKLTMETNRDLNIPDPTWKVQDQAEVPLYAITGPPEAVPQTDNYPICLDKIWDLAPSERTSHNYALT